MAPGVSHNTSRGCLPLWTYCVEELLDLPYWTTPKAVWETLPEDFSDYFLARLLEAYPNIRPVLLERFADSASKLLFPRRGSHRHAAQLMATASRFRLLEAFCMPQCNHTLMLLAPMSHRLRSLELRNSNFSNRNTPELLRCLTNLQHLDLQGSKVSWGLADSLSHLTGLTFLNINRCSISEKELAALSVLSGLTSLRHLDLGCLVVWQNREEVVKNSGLLPQKLATLSQLTFLDISGLEGAPPLIQSLQRLVMTPQLLNRESCSGLILQSLRELNLTATTLLREEAESFHSFISACADSLTKLTMDAVSFWPPYPLSDSSQLLSPIGFVISAATRLQSLTLTGDWCPSRQTADQFPLSLRTLVLSQNNIVPNRGQDDDLMNLGPLTNLQRLEWENSPTEGPNHSEQTVDLWHLTSLTALRLKGVCLTVDRPLGEKGQQQGRFSMLMHLDLLEATLPLRRLSGLTEAAPNLEELHFNTSNILGDLSLELSWRAAKKLECGHRFFSALVRWSHLKRLKLGMRDFLQPSALTPLTELRQLEEIDIVNAIEMSGESDDLPKPFKSTARGAAPQARTSSQQASLAGHLLRQLQRVLPALKGWSVSCNFAGGTTETSRSSIPMRTSRKPTRFVLSPTAAHGLRDLDATIRYTVDEVLRLRCASSPAENLELRRALPNDILAVTSSFSR